MPDFIDRPYGGPSDLDRMTRLVAAVHKTARHTTLHTGDVPHRIFNGLRRYDPADMVRLWEDDAGNLAGWALIYGRFPAFDAVLHPAYRTPDLEDRLIVWAEQAVRRHAQREGPDEQAISTDVFEGDTARIAALERRGYTRGDPDFIYNVCDLTRPIPQPELPEGFTIRTAAGIHEAGKLGAVHSGAFGSNWTPESYRRLMESPGYDADRELVAVAPDGRFAAFCIIWPDEENHFGLFEPVGTHADFRRLGLGRAVLLEGLARLKAGGMIEAVVSYDSNNQAARALYEGVGFRKKCPLYAYDKPVQD